jgi:2-dehydropantoate 2-reductase
LFGLEALSLWHPLVYIFPVRRHAAVIPSGDMVANVKNHSIENDRTIPAPERSNNRFTGQSKIAVMGAGAIGSLLGGLLTKAGSDVTLIGHSDHVDEINKRGLSIEGVSGRFTVSIRAERSLTFRPDLILLAVKMPDLEASCRHLQPFAADVPVLVLQNGTRCDEIAGDILGKRTIIGGIVLFNAQYLKPGQVIHGSRGTLVIGNIFRHNDETVTDLCGLFNRVVPTSPCDSLKAARWTKLLVNVLGNSLDAITGMSLQKCMKIRETRIIGTHLLKEAFNVIAKAGIEPPPLPGMSIATMKLIAAFPLPVASRMLHFVTRKTCTLSSTLQSLRRGKRTEVDYLNGEIVRLGEKVNIPTPYNAKVVELIHAIEQSGRFFDPAVLADMFSLCRRIIYASCVDNYPYRDLPSMPFKN